MENRTCRTYLKIFFGISGWGEKIIPTFFKIGGTVRYHIPEFVDWGEGDNIANDKRMGGGTVSVAKNGEG